MNTHREIIICNINPHTKLPLPIKDYADGIDPFFGPFAKKAFSQCESWENCWCCVVPLSSPLSRQTESHSICHFACTDHRNLIRTVDEIFLRACHSCGPLLVTYSTYRSPFSTPLAALQGPEL